MNITVEAPDLVDLMRDFSNAPARIQKEITTALRKSAVTVQREAIQEAPVNDGLLRANIKVDFPTENSAVVYSGAKYSIYVHEGTRPHFAPFKPIERWARKKGLPAGAVWRAIAKKGTKANKYMDRATKNSERHVQSIFSDANREVAQYLAKGK